MFGRRIKKNTEWLALNLRGGTAEAMSVVYPPGARPKVVRADLLEQPDGDVAGLAALAKRQGWSRYRCTTVLNPGDYQLLQAPAPDVDEAEIKQAVRWQMGDALEFPADSATFDVLTIPQPGNAGARGRSLWVAAAPNAVVQRVMNTFDGAGLELAAIDLPEMAHRNLANLFAEPGRGVAMLHVGEEGALLTFTYDGELYGARRIDVSDVQLRDADADRRASLVERIGLELQRSLDNFERLYTFVGITRLLLAPCAGAETLADELRSFLYIPLELADLTRVLDLDAAPALADPTQQGRYFVTLGAALRTGA